MNEFIPNRYKIQGKIGEGVHGVVVKAIDTKENKIVAIKKVALRTKFGGISPNTLREIKSLQVSECENIITLLDIIPDVAGLALVFEYMPYTLYSRMKDEENPLSRQEVQSYTKMLLKGLAYLHDLKIMHRDIKPANLLINEYNVLKIADFGLARLYDAEQPKKCYSPQVATRWYRAFEILLGSQLYGPPIDIWSAGCVFAEMLRGVPLFAGSTDIEQLALVIRTLGSPSAVEWPGVKNLPDYNKIRFPNAKPVEWENIFPSLTRREEIDLVDRLVRYNPKSRLTAQEALCHEYFNG